MYTTCAFVAGNGGLHNGPSQAVLTQRRFYNIIIFASSFVYSMCCISMELGTSTCSTPAAHIAFAYKQADIRSSDMFYFVNDAFFMCG